MKKLTIANFAYKLNKGLMKGGVVIQDSVVIGLPSLVEIGNKKYNVKSVNFVTNKVELEEIK